MSQHTHTPSLLLFPSLPPFLCFVEVLSRRTSVLLYYSCSAFAHLRDSADITNSERGAGGGEAAEGGGFRRDREASFMPGGDGGAQGKGEAIGGSGR